MRGSEVHLLHISWYADPFCETLRETFHEVSLCRPEQSSVHAMIISCCGSHLTVDVVLAVALTTISLFRPKIFEAQSVRILCFDKSYCNSYGQNLFYLALSCRAERAQGSLRYIACLDSHSVWVLEGALFLRVESCFRVDQIWGLFIIILMLR